MAVETTQINVSGLEALGEFARKLAGQLKPGDVLALNGPMGAGKTTLVQALGKALGVNEKIVSPTFVLIHDYVSGQMPVVHIDFYRLGPENADSIADEVLSVIRDGKSIVIVEWAEYGDWLTPFVTVSVDIEPTGETTRVIRLASARREVSNAF